MAKTPLFSLRQVPESDLHALALGHLPRLAGHRVLEGALPPDFVAQRALRSVAEGFLPLWCNTFYMVMTQADSSALLIVGSCGFKNPPGTANLPPRWVDIGFGVAAQARGQGAATAAVLALLRLAFETADVDTVLAEVEPSNTASTRLVQKLAFVQASTVVDGQGDVVVQWVKQR